MLTAESRRRRLQLINPTAAEEIDPEEGVGAGSVSYGGSHTRFSVHPSPIVGV